MFLLLAAVFVLSRRFPLLLAVCSSAWRAFYFELSPFLRACACLRLCRDPAAFANFVSLFSFGFAGNPKNFPPGTAAPQRCSLPP